MTTRRLVSHVTIAGVAETTVAETIVAVAETTVAVAETTVVVAETTVVVAETTVVEIAVLDEALGRTSPLMVPPRSTSRSLTARPSLRQARRPWRS
jgi:hypothetical protein